VQHSKLILVLGDQLSHANPALASARPGEDVVVMAEVREEAAYVRHNRHKIALIFAAMRHFRDELIERGFRVIYFQWADGLGSLEEALKRAIALSGAVAVDVCEPGEYRVLKAMQDWRQRLGLPVDVMPDTRFLASKVDFAQWAGCHKQLRMEYFYRTMRKRYGILLDEDGKPEGGRWNYDKDNRKGWRGRERIPRRPVLSHDRTTLEVLEEVSKAFPDNPGDLDRFYCAVTASQAQAQFDWFCANALDRFGTWQDAMADESPWLFHSLVSMYLNIGLLEPLAVCRQVERAWRDGHCSLAAAEGFVRQVLGWREYVRGIYWLFMPGYGELNTLEAMTPLPDWFWNARTDLHCLQRSLSQSLELGYGHHIQRLMVIGNFALLAGLDVKEVCDWFLAVYVDAYEWVELPNTLGMALHGDDGLMASKPYAASGKYIQRQGNYCQHCRYDPGKMTGAGACPFNSLYWRFIDRHEQRFASNPRMGLVLANWRKREVRDKRAILAWADQTLAEILPC
jgi:deoxyribodipyrimidine photolyase-related protein